MKKLPSVLFVGALLGGCGSSEEAEPRALLDDNAEWEANATPYGGLKVLANIRKIEGSGTYELDLENELIPDITPLAGLTKSERLFLRDNDITDLTPLAGLTNLAHLNLAHPRRPEGHAQEGPAERQNQVWWNVDAGARRSHFDGRPRDAGIDIRPNPCTVGASAPPPTPNPEVPCCH